MCKLADFGCSKKMEKIKQSQKGAPKGRKLTKHKSLFESKFVYNFYCFMFYIHYTITQSALVFVPLVVYRNSLPKISKVLYAANGANTFE